MLESSPQTTFWLAFIIFMLLAVLAYIVSKNLSLVKQRDEYIAGHKIYLESYERMVILASKHDSYIEQLAIKHNEHVKRTSNDLAILKLRLNEIKLGDLVIDLPCFQNLPEPKETPDVNPENDQGPLPSALPSPQERSVDNP